MTVQNGAPDTSHEQSNREQSATEPQRSAEQPDRKPESVALRAAVTDQIGGVRGMVETTVPVVVFVAVDVFAGLKPGLWAAVGSAVLISIIRLMQRDSPRHALTGLVGVVVAALIAAKTGRAQDFYLPGIALNFLYAVAFVVSAVIRRPLVGYAWALVTGAESDWRARPRVMRAFTWLSLLWSGVFLLRGGVQLVFYLLDMTVGLGIARILGIAPYAAAFALTAWLGQRVVAVDKQERVREAHAE